MSDKRFPDKYFFSSPEVSFWGISVSFGDRRLWAYLRFEDCGHITKIPLQHNSDHDRYFVCHPELRDVSASGKRQACLSAAAKKSRGAGV